MSVLQTNSFFSFSLIVTVKQKRALQCYWFGVTEKSEWRRPWRTLVLKIFSFCKFFRQVFFCPDWPGGAETGRSELVQNWLTSLCTLCTKKLKDWSTFNFFLHNSLFREFACLLLVACLLSFSGHLPILN